MVLKEIIVIYPESYMEQANTLCGQDTKLVISDNVVTTRI
jgi:adenosylmethionine-8-amino-7-oxononanoate aminotransferase